MLCPNELGCTFSRYMIPRTNGEEDLYEMFDGTFLKGDLCNFKVTNSVASDLNDVMYMQLEYAKRCKAVLIKGESLENPLAMYNLSVGQSYTALKNINFYLLFQATEESSGDFAFKIWFNSVNGYGKVEPTKVTYEEDPRNPSKAVEEEPVEEEETKPAETETETDKKDDEKEEEKDTTEEGNIGEVETIGDNTIGEVEKIGDVDGEGDGKTVVDNGDGENGSNQSSNNDDGLNEPETIDGGSETNNEEADNQFDEDFGFNPDGTPKDKNENS